MKKFLLTLILTLTVAWTAFAQGSADLGTMNEGKTNTSNYGTYKSTAGWTTTNCIIYGADDNISTKVFPVLNGRTDKVGLLTSPNLSGSIGKVTVKCYYPYKNDEKGMKFILTIKDKNGSQVYTETFSTTTSTQYSKETFESKDINYTGDFVIEIKNGSPQGNSTANRDRLGIYELTWTAAEVGGGDITEKTEAELILVDNTLTAKVGDQPISVDFAYDGDENPTFKVTSSDENVATVALGPDDTIVITPKGDGTATITLTANATDTYTEAKDTVVITVTDPNKPLIATWDFINAQYDDMPHDDKTYTTIPWSNTQTPVTLSITGDAKDSVRKWSTDGLRLYGNKNLNLKFEVLDKYIITKIEFEGAAATLLKYGENTMSNKIWTGKSSSVEFTWSNSSQKALSSIKVYYKEATQKPAGLAFSSSEAAGTVGEEFDAPKLSNPNNLSVTYTSSNPNLAEVDADGIVTLKAAGIVTITATSAETTDFYEGTAQYTITIAPAQGTIEKKDAELSFASTTFSGTVGEAFAKPTIVNPNELTITYSSSNPDLAEVDAETGDITLKAAGTVTITATSEETEEYKEGKAEYTIKIKPAPRDEYVLYPLMFGNKYNVVIDGVNKYYKNQDQYNDNYSYQLEGIIFSLSHFGNNNNGWEDYIQCGGNGNNKIATITSEIAISKPITSVEITTKTAQADKINSITLQSSATGKDDEWTILDSVDKSILSSSSPTVFTLTNPTPTPNMRYRIVFDCMSRTDNNKNKTIQLSAVKFNALLEFPDEFEVKSHCTDDFDYEYTPADGEDVERNIIFGYGMTTTRKTMVTVAIPEGYENIIHSPVFEISGIETTSRRAVRANWVNIDMKEGEGWELGNSFFVPADGKYYGMEFMLVKDGKVDENNSVACMFQIEFVPSTLDPSAPEHINATSNNYNGVTLQKLSAEESHFGVPTLRFEGEGGPDVYSHYVTLEIPEGWDNYIYFHRDDYYGGDNNPALRLAAEDAEVDADNDDNSNANWVSVDELTGQGYKVGNALTVPTHTEHNYDLYLVKDDQANMNAHYVLSSHVSRNGTTGIDAVEAADNAEYFTLQGVKVANPSDGIFIRVINGKAVKVQL